MVKVRFRVFYITIMRFKGKIRQNKAMSTIL